MYPCYLKVEFSAAITPVFSVMIFQKSFRYTDVGLKKHLALLTMTK